ncbi:5258_t:CDS:1 [Acaulospora morrowiae]|uniref:5258_t:CDS:1 n=1 Tax=Acaulospora morrowiae TaxID=94023 RepID=A0A9N9FQM5_9GLOM|nr:5258_t:CDS:1 [Acaulospora morrowiae]
MNIKNLIKHPTFKKYFYYVTLLAAIYSLVTDAIFLLNLIIGNDRCSSFENNKSLISDVLRRETNIANWDTSYNITYPYYNHYFPENATVFDSLTINRGNYFNTFVMFDDLNKGFKSYAGMVGTVDTSFQPITLVAAADNSTTSYFFIRKGDLNLKSVCQDIIPNCFVKKQIHFPSAAFTFNTKDDFYNTGGVSFSFFMQNKKNIDNFTFNIDPDLHLYVCQYAENPKFSYSWAKKYGTAVGIILVTLESFKAATSLISKCIGDAMPSLVNFSNNSPIWFFLLTKDKYGDNRKTLETAMNLEDANSLQIICDTFLHSMPMLVLTVQSITYRFNEIRVPPPTISILSCVGSCVMLSISLFRIYVAVKVVVPEQVQEFKAEMAQYFNTYPQKRQQDFKNLTFALVDCVINLFPLIFMISLAVKEFNSIFIFIIPILIALCKVLICMSMFWSPRLRGPLPHPIMFSFALNSPIMPFFCIISSSIRQLTTIIAVSGVTAWISWPMDFISIDLPILVVLIMMKVFGYGNSQDVSLIQQNHALVILATFYLVWRIISGLWYTRNCITTQAREDKVNSHSTKETYPFFHTSKNRIGFGIFFYSLCKLAIWVTGLRAIISMVFTSQPPPPIPEAFVTASPKILMVLGLIIYLCLDLIGSLALLISYYGRFSTRTISLYINSSFISFFYTFLGHHFRTEFTNAAKDHMDTSFLWMQRDMVLISSFLFVWPGFGFGYYPYGFDDKYTWWSWYGWGFDVTTQTGMRNDAEWYWSFFGLVSSILGFLYCLLSHIVILRARILARVNHITEIPK